MLIILLQIAMCVLHGGLGLWWRNAHGVHRYALALTITGQVSKSPLILVFILVSQNGSKRGSSSHVQLPVLLIV